MFFVGDRVIERCRNTHNHGAGKIVVKTPARVKVAALEILYIFEKTALIQHSQSFAKKKKSHHRHQIGEIGFFHFFKIYGEIKIEIRERKATNLRQAERDRF